MEEPKLCKVTFIPIGTSVDVPAGTTVLEAARSADVPLAAECGGDGTCGTCRVVICEGTIEVPAGGADSSTKVLSRDELRHGYVLACEARVNLPVTVGVPKESRLASAVFTGDESVERLSGSAAEVDLTTQQLDPLVGKHYLELPAPSLDDNAADLDRLIAALGKQVPGGLEMGLAAMRSLPGAMREDGWRVTATTAHRGAVTEITNVEAGDTRDAHLGLAIDLGTTTVVAHLVDLQNGDTLGSAAKYNSQIGCGADIIHRILFAESEGVDKLQKMIVGDLNLLVQELMTRHHVSPGEITAAVAAGNTTMIHTLLALDPSFIRREPYIGVGCLPAPLRAADIGLEIAPAAELYCLPMISGFVGADTVAGTLAVGIDESDELSVMIDIGTNGEIVIGNSDWQVCASASAGPAFEGSQTQDGMRAHTGAIDHITLVDADNIKSFSTIGSAPPCGICGTGYVDLLAELLRVGVIDRTGSLNTECGSSRVRMNESTDAPEYVIVCQKDSDSDKDIVISQADILSILRAKAAIYAATRILLKSLDLTFDNVEHLYVAGSFGNYLALENAIIIGLLPDMPLEKVHFVGNSCVTGAKLTLLSQDRYRQAQGLARKMTYFELSTAQGFMDEFVSAQFFPHTDIEQFPTAAAALRGRSV